MFYVRLHVYYDSRLLYVGSIHSRELSTLRDDSVTLRKLVRANTERRPEMCGKVDPLV